MEKKLQRNQQEKMLAGVCSGLADYFEIDVTWIRIGFVVATFAGFSGFLAYIILWIAVPEKPFNFNSAYNTDYRVHEDRVNPTYPATDPNQSDFARPLKKRKSNNGRMIVGLIMIVFGAFFLLDEFNFIPYWFDFGKLWPLIFIIPGILMIAKAGRKQAAKENLAEKPLEEIKVEEAKVVPAKEEQSSTNSTSTNTDQIL